MIKKMSTFIFGLLITLSVFGADTESSVGTFIAETEDSLPADTVVLLGNFPMVPGELASPYSVYLRDSLKQAIADSSLLYAERKNLNSLIEEIKLGHTGLIDESTAVEAGELMGGEYMISGSYNLKGESLVLNLDLTSIETGLVKLIRTYQIPLNLLPERVAYYPDNYQDAQFVIEELGKVSDKTDDSLDFRIWTERGSGGVYRDGEALEIFFFSNRDCYVKIYHIDVNKKTSLIFPNQYCSGHLLEAGVLHRIPDSSYPFDFILGEPYGTEFIKVLVSTTPFRNNEEAFTELGSASQGVISRGLSVQQKKTLQAEKLISYYIGK